MANEEKGKKNDPGMYGSEKEFADAVKEMLEVWCGDRLHISVNEVNKNNGVKRTGIVIREAAFNIAPNIYLDGYFEKYHAGMALGDICRAVMETYKESRAQQDFDISDFAHFQKVKDKICYKLINADRNREMLAKMPHREYLDMAVVYYVLHRQNKDCMATTVVDNRIMEAWQTDEKTLYECAQRNLPELLKVCVYPLGNKIMELLGQPLDAGDNVEDSFDCCMRDFNKELLYVASNAAMQNGAAVILYEGVLKEFAGKSGGDFYILPSSIHECLFLPVSMANMESEEIARMVREVNQTEVSAEEVLSDHVYRYDAKRGCVEIAG